MCGIAGIFGVRDSTRLVTLARTMQDALAHRGPDDQGTFIDPDNSIALIQTRLSILDLSQAGHQPMSTGDGRFTIVLNGEVYNFKRLRDELMQAGVSFRGHSDTEVALQLFRAHGPECVHLLEGMFALAIWDKQTQRCFMARDPLGIKPLYFWKVGATLAFASEMRALLSANLNAKRLCARAAREYLHFGSVQEPATLVDGIRMLPAGHWMVWDAGNTEQTEYWKLRFPDKPNHAAHTVIQAASKLLNNGPIQSQTSETNLNRAEWSAARNIFNREKATAVARAAIQMSVEKHLVSDVPVGVFLSGGIDSTAIVAVMRRIGVRDIRTFSISFDDPRYSEGDLARRTADHFGTRHHDWRMTAEIGKSLVNLFLDAVDQPSIDGFNTFCVSKFAHDSGMKVVLSGLGGDEIFGGYPSFRRVPMISRAHRLAHLFGVSGTIGRLVERRTRSPQWKRVGACLQSPPTPTAAYWAYRGIFTPREANLLASKYVCEGTDDDGASALIWELGNPSTNQDGVSEMELTRYMRNQLLRDSDVMSMSWGLELRVPFVDKTLIESVLRIPAALRLARGKRLILDAVPEIPRWIANQPKRGFAFPFGEWVKASWESVFEEIERASPVPLGSWYRKWCVFALERFVARELVGA